MSKSWLRTDNAAFNPQGIGPLFDSVKPKSEVLRDEGIAEVTEHNGKWMDLALCEAKKFVIATEFSQTFTGEDVRFFCSKRIGCPSHPNAWGALTNTLVKRGIIKATGEYRKPKDDSSHARAIQVYRKSL